MKINKIFSLILLFMTAIGNSFAGDSDASIENVASYNASQAEKRFIKAFNTFKTLSGSYPTSKEALEKIRELEDNDAQSIHYILAHPRLIKKDVREEVLRELGASEEDIEASNAKESGKRDGDRLSKSNPMTSQKARSQENTAEDIEPSHVLEHLSAKHSVERDDDMEQSVSVLQDEQIPAVSTEERSNVSSVISAPNSFQLSDIEDDLNNEGANWIQPEHADSNPVDKTFSPRVIQGSEAENSAGNAPKKQKKSSVEVDPSNIIEGTTNRERNRSNELMEEFAPERHRSTRAKKEYANKLVQTEEKYLNEQEEPIEPQSARNYSHDGDVVEDKQGVGSKNNKSKEKRTRLEIEMKKLGL